jgi:hypothetical protein
MEREREMALTFIHTWHRRHTQITNHTVQIASSIVRSGKSWAGPVRCFTQTSTSTDPITATPNSSFQSSSTRRGKHRPHRHRTPHQPRQHCHRQRRQHPTTNPTSMTTNTPRRTCPPHLHPPKHPPRHHPVLNRVPCHLLPTTLLRRRPNPFH